MDRARRAGEIEDAVHLHVDRQGHVVPDDLEIAVVEQVRHVRAPAGIEVIETDDFMAVGDQAIAQVRT
jgi:hypothetical protein